ncbi:hypothetical protein [Pseudodesulfovibrio sediminis]|uniref:DUF3887 domain-containing protein n=1 Tax=Pseudodesulfovibrio sediminis TaxID=2810563 RepID=A0ABN6EWA2_9BACT|nr:hypothetical protein [Pseudodesulfovibrio sediminis]BCS89406.1 hypothetical protein PSDVSF_26480 [Pseudodesulfovibrio sediminis]
MRAALFMSLCLVLILAASPAPAAQGLQPPSGWQQANSGPAGQAEQFLDLMVKGQLDEAFKSLLGKNPGDSLDKLKFEVFSMYKKNGKPVGYDKVMEQNAGKSLLKLRYILLFKSKPVMFDFYYYNPTGQGWKLRTFSYQGKDVKKIFQQ